MLIYDLIVVFSGLEGDTFGDVPSIFPSAAVTSALCKVSFKHTGAFHGGSELGLKLKEIKDIGVSTRSKGEKQRGSSLRDSANTQSGFPVSLNKA